MIMDKPNGGPAFPLDSGWLADSLPISHFGMTLRDYFAAKAIPVVWGSQPDAMDGPAAAEISAMVAYKIADAMLAERAK